MAKIFIVEDSPTDAALLRGLLQNRGHACAVLEGGDGIVASAKSHRPDVILLDVILPKQNGFAICRRLKADPETRGIPVVFVSSRTSENDRFWGRRNGAVAYVAKPVEPEKLYQAVAFALAMTGKEPVRPWRPWVTKSSANATATQEQVGSVY